MPIPKKYLHDRFVLLLVSVNVFLALLCAVLVLLRLGSGPSSGYIVQYRQNLGISAFRTGSVTSIISFIFFAVLTAGTSILLSIRTYHLRRELTLTLLGLGTLLLILAVIVSNSLLVLR